MEIEVVFFSIGIITIIGYVASNIFDRTGIPDTPFLILLGFIGATALSRTASGFDRTGLDFIAPYLAGLAIAVILFNGGMYLKIRQDLNHNLYLLFCDLQLRTFLEISLG